MDTVCSVGCICAAHAWPEDVAGGEDARPNSYVRYVQPEALFERRDGFDAYVQSV